MPIPPLEAPKPGIACLACGKAQLELSAAETSWTCDRCKRAFSKEAVAEIERLQGQLARFPSCRGRDGTRVPVLPGDDCWRVIVTTARCGFVVWSHDTKPYVFFSFKTDKWRGATIHKAERPVEDCFDSKEAAEAGGE